MSEHGSAQAVDTAVLESLGEAVGDMLGEVLDAYLEDAPRRVRCLANAVEAGDAGAMERIAHQLKGSSSNLGAVRLVEQLQALVTCARAGDLAPAGTLYQRVAQEADAVCRAMHRWRRARSV